jgi:hypothetical protein
LHREALKTTWLWGKSCWHLLKLDLRSDGKEATAHGTIWRFWEGVTIVPPTLAPLAKAQPSWIAHSSRLENDDPDAEAWEVDEPILIRSKDQRELPRRRKGKRRVDFTHQVSTGDQPVNCGYRYGISGPFSAHATREKEFDCFSGANAVVVQHSYLIASIPHDLFQLTPLNADDVRANSFATLPSLLPQQYVKRVVMKAKQSREAEAKELFLTWGKWLRVQVAVFEEGSLKLLEKDGSTTSPETVSFPEELKLALEALCGEGRTVFVTRAEAPNPLCYQSLFWPLPAGKPESAAEDRLPEPSGQG